MQAAYPEAPRSARFHLGSAVGWGWRGQSWQEIAEQKKGRSRVFLPCSVPQVAGPAAGVSTLWLQLWPDRCPRFQLLLDKPGPRAQEIPFPLIVLLAWLSSFPPLIPLATMATMGTMVTTITKHGHIISKCVGPFSAVSL